MQKTLVITRQSCDHLYKRTSKFHQNLGELIALKGYSADDFLLQALELGKAYDWMVCVDEDAIITSPQALIQLKRDLEIGNYAFAGSPDGGYDPIRVHNPCFPNPFFCVFHMKEIKSHITLEGLAQFDPQETDWARVEAQYQPVIQGSPWPYACDDFEPTYRVFLYLILQGLTFFPLTEVKKLTPSGDKIIPPAVGDPGVMAYSTILNYKRQELCYHTWWGRAYEGDPGQRERIDRDLDQAEKALGTEKSIPIGAI